MSNISKIIDELCRIRGIKASKMCDDLGLSRSLMTELRSGRSMGVKAETAAKIAEYFGVSVDYLMGKEKPAIDDDESIIILNRGARKMTQEQRRQLLDVAKIMFEKEFKDE